MCAIFCGHFARNKIKKNKKIAGNKLALTALITGYIYIVMLIVFFTFMYFLGKAQMDGYRMFKIEKVVRRCNAYISNNNGKFPNNLQHIFKYNDNHYLISTVTKDTSKSSYKLILKGNIADYPDKSNTVMITEVVPNKRGNKLVPESVGLLSGVYKDFQNTNPVFWKFFLSP